jgi:hypothetical protein
LRLRTKLLQQVTQVSGDGLAIRRHHVAEVVSISVHCLFDRGNPGLGLLWQVRSRHGAAAQNEVADVDTIGKGDKPHGQAVDCKPDLAECSLGGASVVGLECFTELSVLVGEPGDVDIAFSRETCHIFAVALDGHLDALSAPIPLTGAVPHGDT